MEITATGVTSRMKPGMSTVTHNHGHVSQRPRLSLYLCMKQKLTFPGRLDTHQVNSPVQRWWVVAELYDNGCHRAAKLASRRATIVSQTICYVAPAHAFWKAITCVPAQSSVNPTVP